MPLFDEPIREEPEIQPKLQRYERVLLPLKDDPDTWYKIGTYKTPNSAYQAGLNLRNGRYKVPDSPLDWDFINDGNTLYAKRLSVQRNPAPQPDPRPREEPKKVAKKAAKKVAKKTTKKATKKTT